DKRGGGGECGGGGGVSGFREKGGRGKKRPEQGGWCPPSPAGGGREGQPPPIKEYPNEDDLCLGHCGREFCGAQPPRRRSPTQMRKQLGNLQPTRKWTRVKIRPC